MREDELRDRLHEALGEPPPMSEPSLRPSAVHVRRTYAGAMAVLAALLAIVLIIVLVGSRVMLRPQGGVVPTATPSARPAPTPAADSFPCALPAVAVIQDETGPTALLTPNVGFVNVPSGRFLLDPAATVSDLPGSGGSLPLDYSPTAKRWLPARSSSIAPDGMSYTYVVHAGRSSQLHVVDVPSKADRMVWTYAADMGVLAWDQSGILVSTTPFAGGAGTFWRVDPATGVASRAPSQPNRVFPPPGVFPSGTHFSYLGSDGEGTFVFRLEGGWPGAKYSVVMIASGKVTTIYAGTVGDGKDFDPENVYFDPHGLWLSNADATRVWLWNATSGLRSFVLSGLPKIPSGNPNVSDVFIPAGPCVPGTFAGTAHTDWAPLLTRPLQLPAFGPGVACPVSQVQQIYGQVKAVGGKIESAPNYGVGRWPVYLSGQDQWYSAGSQGVGVLTSPEYTGPVLLRARRLDGTGSVTISGLGQDLGIGTWGIAHGGDPPYWGEADGTIMFSAPGCYGVQFDGNSWTSDAVIQVNMGPPPA